MFWNITITENNSVTYTVEANSQCEAESLLQYWLNRNTETVDSDMNYNGYTIGDAIEYSLKSGLCPNIRREEMLEAAYYTLDEGIERALNKMKLIPTDELLDDIRNRVLDDADFEHCFSFNDDDISLAIVNSLNEMIANQKK